ncbi:hypothetical protein BC834DRAFT_974627, partial [Gloeopeniophorella convolvens]
MFLFFLIFLSFSVHGLALQTLFPAAIPLTVRSPYLSCWGGTGANFGTTWPTIATGIAAEQLGLDALVRVDGLTYSFLGAVLGVNATASLTNTLVTPTQTIVTAVAGPLQVNLTFLNPIEPGDFVKQSIPFSYMSLTAKSLDGNAHSVQVYSDVSGEWNSGDRSHDIEWSQTVDPDVIFHTVKLQQQVTFTEIRTQAEWGTLYYAMKAGNNVTWKMAWATASRNAFMANGSLDNQEETLPCHKSPSPYPAINYTDTPDSTQQRPLFYKSKYDGDDKSLIVDFLNDFTDATSRAQTLDSKIQQMLPHLSSILGPGVNRLSTSIWSTQLTIGTDSNGNFNTSDVMMFMKNVGGTDPSKRMGLICYDLRTELVTPSRVNAVETLYAAFPMFLYIDPSLGAPLLEPYFAGNSALHIHIFRCGRSRLHISQCHGSNTDHTEGIEQSGNMLIMVYTPMLVQQVMEASSADIWADYLLNSTLFIHDQYDSFVDTPFALTLVLIKVILGRSDGCKQTNLAIKGIIALEAMSKMSAIVKESVMRASILQRQQKFYNEWKSLALDTDQHLLAVYGNAGSWTLGYNLFADVWLGTNLVDSSVLDGHASFIDNLASTSSFASFGLPVDSLNSDTMTTISSWNLFAAATTPNTNLRDRFISKVHARASFNASGGAFPLNYDSTHGSTILGVASPAQGAMYAPLALKVPVRSIVVARNAGSSSSPKKTSHGGAIAGGIIAGLAALLIVIGAVVFVQRRRKNRAMNPISSTFSDDLVESGPSTRVTPFDPIPIAAPSEAPARPESSGTTTRLTEVSGPYAAEAGGSGSSPSTSSRPLPVLPPAPTPAPVGLSSKELA